MSSAPTTSSGQSTTSTGLAITTTVTFTTIVSGRHRTLMESLLAKKIDLAAGGNPDRPLIRTDSLDSTSSFGSVSSMAYSDDVCRCDDCLLGIADLYTIGPETESAMAKKKVNLFLKSILWKIVGRYHYSQGKAFNSNWTQFPASGINLRKLAIDVIIKALLVGCWINRQRRERVYIYIQNFKT